MCTVSFVRINNRVIITSNRDEHIDRPQSTEPVTEVRGNKQIVYPRDIKAGGTWFAADEFGTVAVLLNGAFEAHRHNPPYRKSRGLVLLEIIEGADSAATLHNVNLENIEPFTVVLFQQDELYELKWDGQRRQVEKIPEMGHHIWSSVTLYTHEVIAKRQELFEQFIQTSPMICAQLIHDFHTDNRGDNQNGFIINRETGMQTFSVTQAVVGNSETKFFYTDLLQRERSTETLLKNHLQQSL